MRFTSFLLLMAVLLFANACRGGSEAPATPAATEVAAPVGPLLAYQSFTTGARVYDIGARRDLLSFPLGAYAITLRPTTDEVIYAVRAASEPTLEIHARSAATGVDRIIYSAQGTTEWSFAISPDGAQLAFTLQKGTWAEGSSVNVLTIATGEVRAIATFGDPYTAAFRGVPVPRVWRRDNGGVLLSGDTASGVPGSHATLKLDGTVVGDVRLFESPSPDGRWLVDQGTNGVGCVFEMQRLAIWDMDALAISASVDDPERGIVVDGWSPDSKSVLYRQYDPKTPSKDDDCVPDYDRATERAYLLSVDGGAPTPVADREALQRTWNRGHDVKFTCGDPPPSPPGAAAPTPNVFGTCSGGRQVLTVDGHPVAEDVDRVLGFLDGPLQG